MHIAQSCRFNQALNKVYLRLVWGNEHVIEIFITSTSAAAPEIQNRLRLCFHQSVVLYCHSWNGSEQSSAGQSMHIVVYSSQNFCYFSFVRSIIQISRKRKVVVCTRAIVLRDEIVALHKPLASLFYVKEDILYFVSVVSVFDTT